MRKLHKASVSFLQLKRCKGQVSTKYCKLCPSGLSCESKVQRTRKIYLSALFSCICVYTCISIYIYIKLKIYNVNIWLALLALSSATISFMRPEFASWVFRFFTWPGLPDGWSIHDDALSFFDGAGLCWDYSRLLAVYMHVSKRRGCHHSVLICLNVLPTFSYTFSSMYDNIEYILMGSQALILPLLCLCMSMSYFPSSGRCLGTTFASSPPTDQLTLCWNLSVA